METVKEILLQNGYDVIINSEKIILLKDGFSHSTPVKNTIKLIEEPLYGDFYMPLKEIAILLADNHLMKKCINRGEEIPSRKLSKDDLFNELKNHFNKDKDE